jgi:hypothetical protein
MTRPVGRCSVETEGGSSYDEADESDNRVLGSIHGDLLLLAMRNCIATIVCSWCGRRRVCEYAHPENGTRSGPKETGRCNDMGVEAPEAGSATTRVEIDANERAATDCRFETAPYI